MKHVNQSNQLQQDKMSNNNNNEMVWLAAE